MAMMITMEEGVMAMEITVTMEMATTMIQMTILFTILYDLYGCDVYFPVLLFFHIFIWSICFCHNRIASLRKVEFTRCLYQ